MKNKNLILIAFSLAYLLFQELSLNIFIFLWSLILLIIMFNKKNHFISILLVLEMFSLSTMMMFSMYCNMINSVSMMFILMTLSVGEAVLGLAILVKLVRWSASEFILGGLN